MFDEYEYEELKPYKGYEVYKTYKVNERGKHISKVKYIVADECDYIGEEYDTIAAAHRFIDSL